MHLIFVYGTLKTQFSNHRILEKCNYVKAMAPDIELHNGPGFPFAKRGIGTTYGELYEVDDATLASLDALEGHPDFYKREKTTVLAGCAKHLAWIYLCDRAAVYPKIESGVWK